MFSFYEPGTGSRIESRSCLFRKYLLKSFRPSEMTGPNIPELAKDLCCFAEDFHEMDSSTYDIIALHDI